MSRQTTWWSKRTSLRASPPSCCWTASAFLASCFSRASSSAPATLGCMSLASLCALRVSSSLFSLTPSVATTTLPLPARPAPLAPSSAMLSASWELRCTPVPTWAKKQPSSTLIGRSTLGWWVCSAPSCQACSLQSLNATNLQASIGTWPSRVMQVDLQCACLGRMGSLRPSFARAMQPCSICLCSLQTCGQCWQAQCCSRSRPCPCTTWRWSSSWPAFSCTPSAV
mmetsp:Transcript_7078/g.22402  ORF Transcript_7078/g.22402 Transcript_7078/m.22402 type:complete len:226 (+) Transcript_7078:249-926(+)